MPSEILTASSALRNALLVGQLFQIIVGGMHTAAAKSKKGKYLNV